MDDESEKIREVLTGEILEILLEIDEMSEEELAAVVVRTVARAAVYVKLVELKAREQGLFPLPEEAERAVEVLAGFLLPAALGRIENSKAPSRRPTRDPQPN